MILFGGCRFEPIGSQVAASKIIIRNENVVRGTTNVEVENYEAVSTKIKVGFSVTQGRGYQEAYRRMGSGKWPQVALASTASTTTVPSSGSGPAIDETITICATRRAAAPKLELPGLRARHHGVSGVSKRIEDPPSPRLGALAPWRPGHALARAATLRQVHGHSARPTRANASQRMDLLTALAARTGPART